jgi:tyrosine-protein kinase
VELAGYLAVARRWWTTLLIATWVAGLAGYLIASGVPPTYEGRTNLLVGPVVGNVDVMRAAGAISYTYAELATAEPALAKARAALALPAETLIVARAIPNETTRVLEIRAEHGDPGVAAAIANFLAANLIDTEAAGVILPEGELSVIEEAAPNPVPIAPQVTLIAMIAAATGLLAAVVLVLLVEYFGNTINSVRELTEVAKVPFHGTAALGHRFRPSPELPSIVEANPDSRAAAAVRMLATKIAYTEPEKPTSSALILGTAPHDGSADLALGIATTLARAGRRVLLVDANEETGELSQLLGIDGSPGLAELLENPQLATDRLVMTRPRGPAVLSRGQNARVDLVDPDTAKRLVERLTHEYEIVFFTGAPIQLSGNVLVWARSTEAVLVAVERDRAKRDDVAYALENLAAVHASVVGTVLLDRAPRPRRDRAQSGSRRAAAALPARSAAPARTRNTRYAAVPPARASIPEAAPVPRRSDQVGR